MLFGIMTIFFMSEIIGLYLYIFIIIVWIISNYKHIIMSIKSSELDGVVEKVFLKYDTDKNANLDVK